MTSHAICYSPNAIDHEMLVVDENESKGGLGKRRMEKKTLVWFSRRAIIFLSIVATFLMLLVSIIQMKEVKVELGKLEGKIEAYHQTKSCDEVSHVQPKKWTQSGAIFDLHLPCLEGEMLEICCDTTTDGGGWLVFQRRMDGSVDFFRKWADYVSGFGKVDEEFWLGLEIIHKITARAEYKLRIDLEDWSGLTVYAEYSSFKVGNSSEDYSIKLGSYSGTAGDSFGSHDTMKFTTQDKDNDLDPNRNCAKSFKGAWWYSACHSANLNGLYFEGGNHSSYGKGIEWYAWRQHHYSMKRTEMKIRRA